VNKIHTHNYYRYASETKPVATCKAYRVYNIRLLNDIRTYEMIGTGVLHCKNTGAYEHELRLSGIYCSNNCNSDPGLLFSEIKYDIHSSIIIFLFAGYGVYLHIGIINKKYILSIFCEKQLYRVEIFSHKFHLYGMVG